MQNELEQMGLTQYESKIYLTLLKEGSSTGRQVRKNSDVPQGKTYEILKNLITKGFVAEKKDKIKQFLAINPETAVKQYCTQKINKIADLQQNLVLELRRLRKKEELPSITERVSLLAGMDAVQVVATELLENSKKEYKVMYTYEQLFYPVIRLLPIKIKEGVKIKFLATKATEQGLKWMKEHTKIGVEVRYYPVEELRITITDNNEAMMMIINPRNRNDRIGMLCKSKEFSTALLHYFDNLWSKSLKITEITTLKELNKFKWQTAK